MKNAFPGCINRLDVAKERMSKPEDMSLETSKTAQVLAQQAQEWNSHCGRDRNYAQAQQHSC